MPSPLDRAFYIWAAVIALCALPYVRLRHQLGIETTETLQWSLVAIGVFGTLRIIHAAWQTSRGRAWRASHGLLRTPI